MKNRVVGAVLKIGTNGWLEDLRTCPTTEERYKKLKELLPEMKLWGLMPIQQLVFFLHHKYELDFGICNFYSISPDDDDRQFCSVGRKIKECTCVFPLVSCILWKKSENPQFSPKLVRGLEQQFNAITKVATQ